MDLDVVAAYLRPRLPNTDGTLSIEQFIGGRANLTYVLHFGAQAYVLRRPPPPPAWPLALTIWRGNTACCPRCIRSIH